MTDYAWPDDLVPFAQSFYLQPHTGGSESPFSRTTKTYGLAAPRWICTMSFRGGYWGTRDQEAFGPRLDALVATLKGRQNRIAIYNFRHSKVRSRGWTTAVGNLAATAGATGLTITGLPPGTTVFVGDYFGGDGRPHIITSSDFSTIAAVANSSGQAVVSFQPPLSIDIAANAAIFGKPTAMFRLTDDDAGQNGVEVAQAINMTLNFVEDLT